MEWWYTKTGLKTCECHIKLENAFQMTGPSMHNKGKNLRSVLAWYDSTIITCNAFWEI